MTSTRSKSKLQSIALWTLIGTTLLSIILLQLKTVSSDSYLISGLIILLIIALFVHGIGMIYNAFLHKRVGWVIAMVVFSGQEPCIILTLANSKQKVALMLASKQCSWCVVGHRGCSNNLCFEI